MKDIPLFSSKTQKSIAKQVLIGFAAIILVGSIILSLPRMTVSGDISYIDALFTATSAICVTGLIVQDTASYFTEFGKIVILLFIQILLREFFGYSLPWGEELAVYMFVWFVFFGASYAAKMAAHNRVTFQFKILPKKVESLLNRLYQA